MVTKSTFDDTKNCPTSKMFNDRERCNKKCNDQDSRYLVCFKLDSIEPAPVKIAATPLLLTRPASIS